MAHNEIKMLAQAIADAIYNAKNPGEAEIDGKVYGFDLYDVTDYETAYTGVTFAGARETYTLATHNVTIEYYGAYEKGTDDEFDVNGDNAIDACELEMEIESITNCNEHIVANVRIMS
jgi:hypothetical protein